MKHFIDIKEFDKNEFDKNTILVKRVELSENFIRYNYNLSDTEIADEYTRKVLRDEVSQKLAENIISRMRESVIYNPELGSHTISYELTILEQKEIMQFEQKIKSMEYTENYLRHQIDIKDNLLYKIKNNWFIKFGIKLGIIRL